MPKLLKPARKRKGFLMTSLKLLAKRSKLSRKLCPLLLFTLILTAFPMRIFAQGPGRPVAVLQSSQPCALNDQSEVCRLRRAVVALQDDIDNLNRKIKAAEVAI